MDERGTVFVAGGAELRGEGVVAFALGAEGFLHGDEVIVEFDDALGVGGEGGVVSVDAVLGVEVGVGADRLDVDLRFGGGGWEVGGAGVVAEGEGAGEAGCAGPGFGSGEETKGGDSWGHGEAGAEWSCGRGTAERGSRDAIKIKQNDITSAGSWKRCRRCARRVIIRETSSAAGERRHGKTEKRCPL